MTYPLIGHLPSRIDTGGSLIRLSHVSKDYSTPVGPFRALEDVNLEIQQGEFVAVIGKSGAGKTTLVNMITGVDHATRGEVVVDGVNLHQMSETQLSRWRGKTIGVVYQSFHLLPGLSLLDNVTLPMDFCQLYRGRQSKDRAMDLLRQIGLEGHAGKRPAEISGGQQQRVAIARALANDPAMIVADEPTGRLDSLTAEAIFEIFEELVRQGKTILMVTHDRVFARRVPRTLEIIDGQVAAYGD
ncbi:MAG TPA: ABC transporter ATP-binding protein [Anaerolineaceae bacterium]|nr:ABC transporter ATP-binding protein [Anaerolineaceae bacterium]